MSVIPNGLRQELRHGAQKARIVVDALRARLQMSERRMRDRYAQMSKNEDIFRAYIPEKENDAIRRNLRDTSGMPQYRTIEIPHSYAVLLTAHTYYTSVFLSRNPVFQLAARHGETEMSVQALEALLDYQRQVGNMMVPLFIWLLDPGKYGFGVLGHYWDRQTTRVRRYVEEPVTWMGMPVPGMKPRITEQVQDLVKFQGNRCFNVRPQDFFPDTRVALRFFQQGEFCGRYVENNWFSIMQGFREGRYFNVDVLRKMRNARDQEQGGNLVARDQGSSNSMQLPREESVTDVNLPVPPGSVKSYEVYVKLVPKEWRFGDGDREEMWALTISTNGVLYGAEPVGELHGDFPFDVIEHEPEGYSQFSRSMLEVCKPLNDVITWLINTHFYNVRASLNNQFLVDPSMVVMKDVEDPNPGKVIRLKPMAYGRDVRTILHQLQVQDITRGHMGDLNVMLDFVQRITGVNEQMMSLANAKSHTTATAVRTSTSFGVNRMKTNCEYYSAMGWAPFTQKLVQRTQQYYDDPMTLRIVGDLAQFGSPIVRATPEMIAGFYDWVPVDGTLPVDRFAQANLWQMIMGQMKNFPQIMMAYDVAKIFGWVANLAGIKNLAQFKITPDAALLQQAQMGNVIPLGKADAPKGRVNLNEPAQVPGVGATG
jgi:hypothetical protein